MFVKLREHQIDLRLSSRLILSDGTDIRKGEAVMILADCQKCGKEITVPGEAKYLAPLGTCWDCIGWPWHERLTGSVNARIYQYNAAKAMIIAWKIAPDTSTFWQLQPTWRHPGLIRFFWSWDQAEAYSRIGEAARRINKGLTLDELDKILDSNPRR